jgi:hypothetical protein
LAFVTVPFVVVAAVLAYPSALVEAFAALEAE